MRADLYSAIHVIVAFSGMWVFSGLWPSWCSAHRFQPALTALSLCSAPQRRAVTLALGAVPVRLFRAFGAWELRMTTVAQLDALRASAAVGDVDAVFTLWAIDIGDEVYDLIDDTERLRWMRCGALAGSVRARYLYALCLDDDRYGTPDPRASTRWFLAAARQGHMRAQYRAASALCDGVGCAPDHAHSVRWLRRGQAQGHGPCTVALAQLHRTGDGVESDPVKARRWFDELARAGCVDSMRALAVMLHDGEGGDRDRTLAYAWTIVDPSSADGFVGALDDGRNIALRDVDVVRAEWLSEVILTRMYALWNRDEEVTETVSRRAPSSAPIASSLDQSDAASCRSRAVR